RRDPMTQQATNISLNPIIQCDEDNFLPYSIAFDILNNFKNRKLNKLVQDTLNNYLPQSSQYKNNLDLWVDLESCGDITILMAKKLADIFCEFMRDHAVDKIILQKSYNSIMTRDNNWLIYSLQEYELIKIDAIAAIGLINSNN